MDPIVNRGPIGDTPLSVLFSTPVVKTPLCPAFRARLFLQSLDAIYSQRREPHTIEASVIVAIHQNAVSHVRVLLKLTFVHVMLFTLSWKCGWKRLYPSTGRRFPFAHKRSSRNRNCLEDEAYDPQSHINVQQNHGRIDSFATGTLEQALHKPLMWCLHFFSRRSVRLTHTKTRGRNRDVSSFTIILPFSLPIQMGSLTQCVSRSSARPVFVSSEVTFYFGPSMTDDTNDLVQFISVFFLFSPSGFTERESVTKSHSQTLHTKLNTNWAT